mmetsp:Transcript_138048/g.240080  ORF Transcript_138048/g.240080 Transcript_138048/m.240080 type:complete len:218 (-) Transcript_138048:223-876(-)
MPLKLLVLLCLAYPCPGRRVQTSVAATPSDHRQSNGAPESANSLTTLARLLTSSDAAAAWQASSWSSTAAGHKVDKRAPLQPAARRAAAPRLLLEALGDVQSSLEAVGDAQSSIMAATTLLAGEGFLGDSLKSQILTSLAIVIGLAGSGYFIYQDQEREESDGTGQIAKVFLVVQVLALAYIYKIVADQDATLQEPASLNYAKMVNQLKDVGQEPMR